MKPTECDGISDNSEEEVMIHRSPKLAHSITSIDSNYMIHNDDDDSDSKENGDDEHDSEIKDDGSEDHGTDVNRVSRDEFCRRTFILARDEQVIQGIYIYIYIYVIPCYSLCLLRFSIDQFAIPCI